MNPTMVELLISSSHLSKCQGKIIDSRSPMAHLLNSKFSEIPNSSIFLMLIILIKMASPLGQAPLLISIFSLQNLSTLQRISMFAIFDQLQLKPKIKNISFMLISPYKQRKIVRDGQRDYHCSGKEGNSILLYNTTHNIMNFQAQKKILEPLLKSATNRYCADCNAASPTWASLDFGVFLCSNCAGAHRALGPTITRVRSANLDLWQHQWIENMLIGNQELNAYWESDPHCYERKPNWGSSNPDIARYVYEKYVKRKYVKDPSIPDPLALSKRSKFQSKPYMPARQEPSPVYNSDIVIQDAPEVIIKEPMDHPDLISFNFDSTHQAQSYPQESHSSGLPQTHLNHHIGHPQQLQPDLSDIPDHGTSFTTQNSDFMSFDEMVRSQKNTTTPLMHSLSSQQIHRPTFTVPHIQTNQPHLHPSSNQNLGFNYNQQYQHHQYPQSPQPLLHNHLQNQPQTMAMNQMNGHHMNYGQQGQLGFQQGYNQQWQ